MGQRVLGLDLGPNSIGWALVEDDFKNPEKSKIIDLGVRVFPEGVDAFDTSKELSPNETRRVARGMRRQTQRRNRRRRYLQQSLVQVGLLPSESAQLDELCHLDPYELRSRGLREKLSPFEIGRLFLHLCQRRGFQSNRKKDRADAEVKGMLAEIQENDRERQESGHPTIGAWLHHKLLVKNHAAPAENDHVRTRHLSRKQYLDEFEAIWAVQSTFHAELLTEKLKYGRTGNEGYPIKPKRRDKSESPLEAFGVFGLLYFQRPMYWPKSVIGLCELEPKQKRCPVSDRRYQRFRMLQEVNNLKYSTSDTFGEIVLEPWQRQRLVKELSGRNEMTFDQIRKCLEFLESVKFNLERGKRSKLKGATIDRLISAKGVLGPDWHDRPESEKTAIVQFLLDAEKDDQAMLEQLVKHWKIEPQQADALLAIDFPPGYGNLSRLALDKLLPFLEQGLRYMANDESDSAMHAAGYFRRDQLQRRIFDQLPNPQRVKSSPIGDIPNPVVKRSLTEVRRVVNAIIREHGKPDAVHIEMTREVKQGKVRRNEHTKMMRDRENTRSKIADELQKNGIRPNRDSILKYQLWQEQDLQCIYSGQPISFSQLFSDSGGIEVDHILPRSRTLDDSQMNKAVCQRSENANKGDLTPYQWLAGSDREKYDKIWQRAGRLMRNGKIPYAKYRRFIQKELDLDDFIARQLNDTSYLTKATAEYLRCLFEQEHDVLGLKGQLTAELRWHWGLETVLSELPDSPAWHEASKLRDGEKNRADHRHHAIDAIVIALTNRSRLQLLSKIVKTGGAKKHGEVLFDPWENFRNDVKQRIAAVNVSHRVERKVCGALHEETVYGQTDKADEWVVRKPLISLSANEIEKIRDETIKRLVMEKLKANGIEFGRKKEPDKKKMAEVLSQMTMPSGVPIKKVRILKNEKTIQKLRPDRNEDRAYVKPGSTHHLCIFEREVKGKVKREAVFVTMLEAMQRLKNHEPIIRRNHPDYPNALFVMSLGSREMFLADWKGEEKLLTYKTAASTQGQIYFAEHNDSRKSSDYKKFAVNCNTLNGKKVTVDPLGRIRWAND